MNNSIKTAAKTMAAVIAAGAMAVAPVAGTINFGAMTVMAAAQKDATTTVKVSGLESGKTQKVYAYQVVKATWNSDSTFKGYEFVNETAAHTFGSTSTSVDQVSTVFGSTDGYTKAKVTAMATTILNARDKAPYTGYTTSFAAVNVADTATEAELTLPAGTYVVFIENVNDASTIYSPMLISAHYATQDDVDKNLATAVDTLIADNVSASGTYNDNASAKHTTIDVTKKITNPDSVSSGSTNGSATEAVGDDLQVGDYAKFTITTQIPAYTDDYTTQTLTFDVIDDQEDNKFSAPVNDTNHPMTVTVGKTDTAAGTTYTNNAEISDVYTYTAGTFSSESGDVTAIARGIDFKISFDSNYIKQHVGESVTVTYYAQLTSDADQEFDANTDTAHISYTNDLYTHKSHDDSTVNEYSFPLTVLKKDGSGNALGGAVFSLTRETKSGTDYSTSTFADQTSHVSTGEGDAVPVGTLSFSHLDEGTYYLVEKSAPAGYTKADVQYKIEITPEYNFDGTLTKYSVKVTPSTGKSGDTYTYEGAQASTKKYTADGKALDSNGNVVTTNVALEVTNTSTSGLPATGARSALILTIAGLAVMVTVMAASRKKKIEE